MGGTKVDGHGQAKVLTPGEIAKLFEALEGDRDRALFGICLYRTHLRSQGEAASRLSISLTKQRLILVVA